MPISMQKRLIDNWNTALEQLPSSERLTFSELCDEGICGGMGYAYFHYAKAGKLDEYHHCMNFVHRYSPEAIAKILRGDSTNERALTHVLARWVSTVQFLQMAQGDKLDANQDLPMLQALAKRIGYDAQGHVTVMCSPKEIEPILSELKSGEGVCLLIEKHLYFVRKSDSGECWEVGDANCNGLIRKISDVKQASCYLWGMVHWTVDRYSDPVAENRSWLFRSLYFPVRLIERVLEKIRWRFGLDLAYWLYQIGAFLSNVLFINVFSYWFRFDPVPMALFIFTPEKKQSSVCHMLKKMKVSRYLEEFCPSALLARSILLDDVESVRRLQDRVDLNAPMSMFNRAPFSEMKRVPLSWAVNTGSYDCVTFILEAGAEIAEMVLYGAVVENDVKMVQLLLQYPEQLVLGKWRCNVMAQAVANNNLEMVKLLAKHFSDFDRVLDYDAKVIVGRPYSSKSERFNFEPFPASTSALMLAAQCQYREIYDYLIECGADPGLKDAQGLSAQHYLNAKSEVEADCISEVSTLVKCGL